MKVFISQGNSKLGQIPNVSLPPLVSCVDNPPCAELCYARKFHAGFARHTAGVKWDQNYDFYLEHPNGYFMDIHEQLYRKKNISLFRWHVGGDIPDKNYFMGMENLAELLPRISFLAYTRRDFRTSVKNLTIVRSVWFGDECPEDRPWFKVIPKGEPATCQGTCDECAACWNLKPGQGMTVNLH